MNFLQIALLYYLFKYIKCQSDEEIQYYVDLINTNVKKSLNYVLPTDATSYEGNYFTSAKVKDYGYFDFIVVGMGSTGAALTGSLVQKNEWSVLALEAGTWESNFTDIPSFHLYYELSDYNWGFTSVPQKNACLAMTDRKCVYPRGKGLGGSTLLNSLIYARGNKKDFDIWSSLVNDGTWSYKDVLPYFKLTEHSYIDGDVGYHGFKGPLDVNYYKPSSPQLVSFLEANKELGQYVTDYNGKSEFGVANTQFNTRNGRRLTSAKAFLFPSNNLKILPKSYVTKLIINKFNKVEGVEFMNKGIKSIARARKDVIISAGVFGSATILMQSGIGPAKELEANNITVVNDLPVGKNLHDHAAFYGLFFHTNYTEESLPIQELVKQYLNGIGPYTIASNLQGIGFFETKYAIIPGVPDIEILMVPSNSSTDLAVKVFGLTQDNYDAAFKNIQSDSDFAVVIILLKPRSVGTVKLKSNNVFDYPLINPKFLSDPEGLDLKTILEGVKIVINMLNTTALQGINATLAKVDFPACANYEYLTTEYWECNIRQYTFNIFHPVGTCKMSRYADGGVVDNDFKVYGMKNLRVSDVSVFPFALSGHPSAPAMMMGYKFADMLAAEYSNNMNTFNNFSIPN